MVACAGALSLMTWSSDVFGLSDGELARALSREASMHPGANYRVCRDTLLTIHGNGVWRAVAGPG
eukprot:1768423-Lingulodinium_polyedra.AAC.1